MRVLIIGGTGFVGGRIAAAAVGRGHRVTVLSRGRTSVHVPPPLEHLMTDRTDLAVLAGRRWDAVVDVYGHLPDVVGASAAALAHARVYAFVSSTSVYAPRPDAATEDAAVRRLSAADAASFTSDEAITSDAYGPLKTGCEDAVRAVFDERALIVRPVLICGPGDRYGRLPHWLGRLSSGGEILAPGDPARPVQTIDVRDLASFIVSMTERGAGGTFNVGSPEAPSFAELLAASARHLEVAPRLTWVDDAFLLREGLSPDGDEPPLWFTAEAHDWAPVEVGRALGAGLPTRPLADTIAATWEWMQEARFQPAPAYRRLERRLLGRWRRGDVA